MKNPGLLVKMFAPRSVILIIAGALPEYQMCIRDSICTTYPTVDGITQYSTALSNSLMFDRYSKADYSTIFQKAEQSSNLKARTHDEESPVDFGWILEHSKEIKDGAFDN